MIPILVYICLLALAIVLDAIAILTHDNRIYGDIISASAASGLFLFLAINLSGGNVYGLTDNGIVYTVQDAGLSILIAGAGMFSAFMVLMLILRVLSGRLTVRRQEAGLE